MEYLNTMPELPEVQTVVSQIAEKLKGKQVKGLWSDWQKRIHPSFPIFVKRVKGSHILGTRRFGKHIVIDFDNEYSIVVHLKMTGHFLIKNKTNRNSKAFTEDPVNRYIHHILTFIDDTTLEFSDMRKFGWMQVVETRVVEDLPSIASLGVDALSERFTVSSLQKIIEKRKKKTIGEVLLEQNVIAGIGNIYRSEALFLAHILPWRLTETLSLDEQKELVSAVKKVLRQALRLGGMSDGDFRDTDGKEGRFQETRYVYGRADDSCKKCGTIIVRKKLGQRSAFFCPQCQH
ncbi:MAG: hypothetical protein COZ27_02050 [Candidatus Moranbacteria bacterium CG_4_10_14_3_um_filter_41_65]|nr:MAG: hypothetical protein COZ86_04925 [Candidatus Moranbacteria bacterium CG_4_8_14_3_um_filter_41_13]PIX91585.1 MAG: hypothetical protein COZ27_02050 [Candidatus Moranbacteria bacterium CG_4_10_14_3_um_filter_41_65]PJC00190.1 MAG: hypothetical protein CO075_01925 [Candidatus Moranbacteria bacterium CG_4_9_14_0_8_um_filter_41_43]